eukprot:15003150-Alexandrium_andersonii.AAC.1
MHDGQKSDARGIGKGKRRSKAKLAEQHAAAGDADLGEPWKCRVCETHHRNGNLVRCRMPGCNAERCPR